MKRKISLLILFLFITTSLGWAALFLTHRSPQTTMLEFPKGTSLRTISRRLAEHKVISHPLLFEAAARLSGKGKRLRAGEYEFLAGITPLEALMQMAEGRVKLYPMTVPEGFNLREIGNLARNRNLKGAEEWERLTKNKEGFLFPETYLLEKGTTAQELVEQMEAVFREKVTPDLIQKARERGFPLDQWMTLASLVEKETGVPVERPLIAAVFLNRLKQNMLLQTDPSVIYGIQNFNGNLTRQDLLRDTPYNTYLRPGLPAGPICSPGLDSLMAVLNPAPTDYLYFVAKGDGTHHFSKTREDHNRAVDFYQLHQGTPP